MRIHPQFGYHGKTVLDAPLKNAVRFFFSRDTVDRSVGEIVRPASALDAAVCRVSADDEGERAADGTAAFDHESGPVPDVVQDILFSGISFDPLSAVARSAHPDSCRVINGDDFRDVFFPRAAHGIVVFRDFHEAGSLSEPGGIWKHHITERTGLQRERDYRAGMRRIWYTDFDQPFGNGIQKGEAGTAGV